MGEVRSLKERSKCVLHCGRLHFNVDSREWDVRTIPTRTEPGVGVGGMGGWVEG